ncbi:MAG TPA: TIGR02281 family clan AA aspartic protease [Phenylobacterium sp.]|nr:TIGR02281 family clan AA aspartic protease [Phenylobacterium sp.]HQN51409.1 TIGR02281 family clan AA aspartic protease [Phenylobacterium sp.]
MLRMAVLALVGAVSAVGTAQAVAAFDPNRHLASLTTETVQAPIEAAATGEPAQIAKAADGHYWAEASVNGSRVRFLVDTGASAVALTPDDAKRLGFEPSKLNYAYKVMTANGEAHAAAVKLASVSVAGTKVTDVDALVLDKGLDASLLGMTYLGRLSRFEATRSSLILRP